MRLEDQLAARQICKEIMIAFGRYRDDRDPVAIAAILATNCVWERDGTNIEGRDAICAIVKEMPPEMVLRHVFTNILVNVVDEDHAEAKGYYTVYGNRANVAGATLPRPLDGPMRVGDYICRFIREDGSWKLSFATARRVFSK